MNPEKPPIIGNDRKITIKQLDDNELIELFIVLRKLSNAEARVLLHAVNAELTRRGLK